MDDVLEKRGDILVAGAWWHDEAVLVAVIIYSTLLIFWTGYRTGESKREMEAEQKEIL